MEKTGEIARLESYVERLLERFNALKAEKQRLEKDLVELRDENDQQQRRLERLDSERGEMSSRVSSLIDRIEQWESELQAGAEPEEEHPETGAAEMAEKLPAHPAQTRSAEEESGSSRLQGSLFSARSNAG